MLQRSALPRSWRWLRSRSPPVGSKGCDCRRLLPAFLRLPRRTEAAPGSRRNERSPRKRRRKCEIFRTQAACVSYNWSCGRRDAGTDGPVCPPSGTGGARDQITKELAMRNAVRFFLLVAVAVLVTAPPSAAGEKAPLAIKG